MPPTTHILSHTTHTSTPIPTQANTHRYTHPNTRIFTNTCIKAPAHTTTHRTPDTYINTHPAHRYIHLNTHTPTSMCPHTNMHSPKPHSHTNISANPDPAH